MTSLKQIAILIISVISLNAKASSKCGQQMADLVTSVNKLKSGILEQRNNNSVSDQNILTLFPNVQNQISGDVRLDLYSAKTLVRNAQNDLYYFDINIDVKPVDEATMNLNTCLLNQ